MTDQQSTITVRRQQAASQVAAVFASLHQFLETLKHKTEAGESIMTEQLRHAHARIEEAGTWAVKHVLTFGTPKADAPPAPATEAPIDPPAPAAADVQAAV